MENILNILKDEPGYRAKQIFEAWFNPKIKSYGEITTLPLELRNKLKDIPWLAVKLKTLEESKIDGTKKALLELDDKNFIETVLIPKKDKKEKVRHTICVSAQVGCPMGCLFCSTGKIGFKRNLSPEEIIGQYRFWQNHLGERETIDNMVVMGQGEPLLNYEAVKEAINTILKYTGMGKRKIIVSTVGVKETMEKLLEDKDFPQIRIAISLHSAIEATRKQIIPSHKPGFLKFLTDWSKKYFKVYGGRMRFLTLEYALLNSINDDDEHLLALTQFARQIGRVKINLIPLNEFSISRGPGIKITPAPAETIRKWQKKLMEAGLVCTIRKSLGSDISAACGQLAGKE